jgi:ribosomal protein S18 acetylase RimI-like enzyme
MKLEYRNFKRQDYITCESLVNEAWGFDEIFPNTKLASFAKLSYTKGSLVYSNYRKVAVSEGLVVGFIFGFNNKRPKPIGRFIFSIFAIWKFLTTKSSGNPGKSELINTISGHEINRKKVLSKGNSEIVLFVISKKFRGAGIGTVLWEGFKHHCEKSGIQKIFVETNKLGASGFYEKIGFTHESDFNSPLGRQWGRILIINYSYQTVNN